MAVVDGISVGVDNGSLDGSWVAVGAARVGRGVVERVGAVEGAGVGKDSLKSVGPPFEGTGLGEDVALVDRAEGVIVGVVDGLMIGAPEVLLYV